MNNLLKVTFLAIVSLCITFCKDPKPSETPSTDNQNSNRTLMLTYIADEIIIPSYSNFKTKLDTLNNKINTFSNSPNTANLTELRSAWVEAYTEWQKVELFDVGPANDYSLRNYFNIYPANELAIRSNILDPNANLEYSSNITAQGFPALDFLINGLAATDADIVNLYVSTSDTIAPKRLAYLKKLSAQMQSKFNQTNSAWNSTYRNDFISNTSLSIGGSTSKLLNGFVLNYERYLRAGKFAIPSGAISGTSEPTKVEAFYKKDISKQLAIAAQKASVDFFNGKSVKTGTEGFSLKSYLNGINAKDSKTGKLLSEALNEQFVVINTQTNSLTNNFFDLATNDNQKLIATYDEIQKAVRMLKVDMTSAMSITITYADADGD